MDTVQKQNKEKHMKIIAREKALSHIFGVVFYP
jgi:hypothetical protein